MKGRSRGAAAPTAATRLGRASHRPILNQCKPRFWRVWWLPNLRPCSLSTRPTKKAEHTATGLAETYSAPIADSAAWSQGRSRHDVAQPPFAHAAPYWRVVCPASRRTEPGLRHNETRRGSLSPRQGWRCDASADNAQAHQATRQGATTRSLSTINSEQATGVPAACSLLARLGSRLQRGGD